jgi:hypothetical protein
MSKAANKTNGEAAPDRLAVLTDALERAAFAQRLGLMYDGNRDIGKMAGYKTSLRFDDYWGAYQRDGVAGQIVDMIAEATWRKAPEVSEPEQGEDGTEFSKAWQEMADRLAVYRVLFRADVMARLGRYSVVLIGTGEPDQAMARPLTSVRGPEGVLYLRAYTEQDAEIQDWVEDASDPAFGLPKTYTINVAGALTGFRAGAARLPVHRSRIIHVAQNTLRDDVYGRPELQRVFNDLQDLLKISASSSEAFWQRVAGVLQAILDEKVQPTPAEIADLTQQIHDLNHDLARTFVARGARLERLAETEPNPAAASKLVERRIAAGSGYPARMLFGSETGERASTEDVKAFLGSAGERQLQFAEPVLLRPLIDRLVSIRALPRHGKKGYDVVWPSLYSESEQVIAETNRATAETARALTPVGGDPIELVEVDEDRRVWMIPFEAGDPPRAIVEPPDPMDVGPEPPAAMPPGNDDEEEEDGEEGTE